MKTESLGKKVTRGVITAVLILIFSSSLTLGILSFLGGSSFTADACSETAVRIRYGEKMREEIREGFESLCLTTGIPSSLTDSFLEECVSDEDLRLPILQMKASEVLTHDTASWNAELCRRMELYATTLRESGELELTEEEWEQMKKSFPETASHFISEITGTVRLSGIFSVVGSAVKLVERLKPYLLLASALFLFFSAVLLLLIQKKRLPLLGYVGVTGSGLLFLVPSLILKNGAYVARLRVEPLCLKELFVSLSDDFFNKLLLAGACLCAAGIAFGVLAFVFALKKKNGEPKNEAPEEMKGDEAK